MVGCQKSDPTKGAAAGKGKGAPASPVVVAEVKQQAVPLAVRAIGNIESFSVVEVRSQVSGPIAKVLFEEGQEVQQGQILFELDPRPFQQSIREMEAEVAARKAALAQVEAALERDQANAKNAKSQADRSNQLATAGIIAKEQNEQFQTTALAAEKAVTATRASIESARAAIAGAEAKLGDARLQLSYATIRAPISGRVGTITRKAGLVSANSETLVTINQITPIYATFSVPEQSLPELRRYASGGKLKVQATPQNSGTESAAHGTLDFLDNRIDSSTGTIMLKARFPNQDRKLWPGQFVNVNVQLAVGNEIVAPTAAVKTAQEGNYVFVVKPDMTAEQRTVQTARAFEDVTVIQNGLNPGERVIVEGHVRVKNGSKVRISGEGGPKSDGALTQKAALEQ